jgi:hypothetical protein
VFGDRRIEAAARWRPRPGSRVTVTIVAVLSGVALVAAGCASGHSQSSARHHASKQAAAERPVTKPQILTTTSSTAATTTTTSIKVVPPAAPAPPAPPPTTTTTAVPLPPVCNWSDFSTTVATDQAAYPQGQTVHITLTYRNAGPRCTLFVTGYGCPDVDVENAGGQPTWTTASEPTTGCAATFTPGSPTVLDSTWSQSYPVDWTQVDCSTRTGGNTGTCAGQQVAAGQYQIIGKDTGGVSRIPPSAPLVVTIS